MKTSIIPIIITLSAAATACGGGEPAAEVAVEPSSPAPTTVAVEPAADTTPPVATTVPPQPTQPEETAESEAAPTTAPAPSTAPPTTAADVEESTETTAPATPAAPGVADYTVPTVEAFLASVPEELWPSDDPYFPEGADLTSSSLFTGLSEFGADIDYAIDTWFEIDAPLREVNSQLQEAMAAAGYVIPDVREVRVDDSGDLIVINSYEREGRNSLRYQLTQDSDSSTTVGNWARRVTLRPTIDDFLVGTFAEGWLADVATPGLGLPGTRWDISLSVRDDRVSAGLSTWVDPAQMSPEDVWAAVEAGVPFAPFDDGLTINMSDDPTITEGGGWVSASDLDLRFDFGIGGYTSDGIDWVTVGANVYTT